MKRSRTRQSLGKQSQAIAREESLPGQRRFEWIPYSSAPKSGDFGYGRWIVSLALILFIATPVVAEDTSSTEPPNLVVIVADDLGWCDLSTGRTNYGHPSNYNETPYLTYLAEHGMAFTNAYVNQNCAPTRTALLSGQYASRSTNGVFQVGHLNRGGQQPLIGPPQGVAGRAPHLPRRAVTFADVLQQAGYQTAHFGKFHVTAGEGKAITATNGHGFDENYGGTSAGAPSAYHARQQTFGPRVGPELDAYAANYTKAYIDEQIRPFSRGSEVDLLVGTDKHLTDAMADAAVEYIKRQPARPVYLQYHPYAVHTPIGPQQARRDLLAKHEKKRPGQEDAHTSYAALVENLDQAVGRLHHALQSTPDPRRPGKMLIDNTVVLFLSDNGGRESQANNGPLKGQKGELDEGGIRVPLIAYSGNPELVAGATINHTPVAAVDLYPTLCALAGAKLPDSYPLDGVDLTPILADPEADLARDDLFWHLPGYLIDRQGSDRRDQHPQSVIRHNHWKLLYNYEDQTYELYDLANDIGETTNLAEARPEVTRRLAERLAEWLAEVDASLATLREGPVELEINGGYYADGSVRQHQGTLSIQRGDEMPLVLP